MRFAIFTHVEHFQKDGRFFSYSPYVREMNLWLKNVSEVHIVAPLSSEEDSRQSSYSRKDIVIHNVPSFHFLNFGESLRSFFLIPGIIYAILKTMKQADYLHLRCPGNIGLLACFAQIFFPRNQNLPSMLVIGILRQNNLGHTDFKNGYCAIHS